MTPAEEFRTSRTALGMTQQQLGEAVGYKRGRQTIYDIEKGVWMPSEPVLRYLRTRVAAGARPTSKLG